MDQLKELLPLLVRRLNDRETDSSSSDDELDLHILKQFRPIQDLNDRTGDYMQIVDQYSDSEFKEQFRYLQNFMLNVYSCCDIHFYI